MIYIKQWIIQHSLMLKRIGMLTGILLAVVIFFVGLNSLVDLVHDYRYNKQQDNFNRQATQSETNANLHEANANSAANNIKELEKDEERIKQKQADLQKILTGDQQQTSNTRDTLNKSLNQNMPNRTGDDGTDDDQLRTDADRAANSFNRKRTKGAATAKP